MDKSEKTNYNKSGECTAKNHLACKYYKPISERVAWCKYCLLGRVCESRKAGGEKGVVTQKSAVRYESAGLAGYASRKEKRMSDKFYSTNGEDFTFTEIEEAIESAITPAAIVGQIVTIFEGDAKAHKAGDFATFWPIDKLKENAFEDGGEYAETWLDKCTKEQEGDLEDRIKSVVNQWADDYGLQPNFYGIEHIKTITVEMLDSEGNYKVREA